MWGDVLEETAPGAENMHLSWMIPFWASFTDCVIELDAQHIITNVRRKSESSSAVVGLTGKSFSAIAAEKDRDLVEDNLHQLKTAAVPYLRFQFLLSTGRYYRWTLIPFYKEGIYSGCHGVAVDVTEQTIKEITLNWQSAVMDDGRDFVRIFDLDMRILYTSPGAYKMTGYDSTSDMPSSEHIYTPEHYKNVYGNGLETINKQGFWIARGELVRSDGTLIPIEHTMFSISNDQGEVILLASVIRDITVFIEHEKDLEEARLAAEAANVAKSDFLSRMSHEIRTPMNAIIGMTNIGLGASDIERKNYCFTRVDSAAKHLLDLINDILDMSKIEADKLDLSYSEFDFEKVLKNITNIASIRAEEKQLHFIVKLSSDVPAFIICDEMRLSQVITNLLTNAIKFTPENGTVTLNIDKTSEDGDEITLRFEVIDTGIGITKEQQERLFTSFNQADASISQKYGGTGLGLAISKRIVEIMGGEIWVISELGQGAAFIFTIRVKKAEGKAQTQHYERIRQRNLRILAVDDATEVRDYFKQIMDALKLQCDVASDGHQALQLIQDTAADPYNIFFIDWKMPGMDGIELTRKIKEISNNNSIVIMTSASDWNSVEKEAAEAGVNHFISKPLFPSTLVNSIELCLGAELSEIKSDADNNFSKQKYDFSEHTILIAEDIEINREIISAILEETRICVEYAEDGKKAISMFSENPGRYELVLMDINMPEMDGYEATRQIRSLDIAKAKSIPIIAMTANVFKEDIEKCISSGMNDHTGKPIDADELLDKIYQYIK